MLIFWVNTKLVKKSFWNIWRPKNGLKIDGSPHDDVVSPLVNFSPLLPNSLLFSESWKAPAPCQYAHKMEEEKQEAPQNGIPDAPCQCAHKMEDYEG